MDTIDYIGDNMKDRITSMQIHESTLKKLHEQKRFQESYEDVVLRLLHSAECTD